MYAIVDIAGKQMKVSKDQKVVTPKLSAEVGSSVEFDNVLLIDNDGKVTIGTPSIKKAKVTAKVLDHGKDSTVVVFKKKRRKGYRVKNGHRQEFSKIQIESIA